MVIESAEPSPHRLRRTAVSSAFEYAVSRLPALLREHARIYAVVCAIGGVLALPIFRSYFPLALAIASVLTLFTILAASARDFVPSYRMTGSDAGNLVVLYLVEVVLLVPIAVALLLALQSPPVARVLLITVCLVGNWIGIKVSPAMGFFALARGHNSGGTIGSALAKAWRNTQGSIWWSLFGFGVVFSFLDKIVGKGGVALLARIGDNPFESVAVGLSASALTIVIAAIVQSTYIALCDRLIATPQ